MKGVKDLTLDDKIMEYMRRFSKESPAFTSIAADYGTTTKENQNQPKT
jgi:hypothetical protein